MTLSLWELIGLFIAFCGCIGFFLKLILDMLLKGLDERFKAGSDKFEEIEELIAGSNLRLGERFASIDREMDRRISAASTERAELRQQDRRMLDDIAGQLRTVMERMPELYVRREDWIRFSSTIESKQDRLAEKFEQLRNDLLKEQKAKA